MNFARFFVDRPIFAAVLSIVIFLAGLIAMFQLPISEYPEVVPPTVVVSTHYSGANPQVIAETVAAPLEQAINGVEGMLYQSSQSTSDGAMRLTITFEVGTDIDNAQVQVQNRVSQALPKLPEDVRRVGVTTIKNSPDLLMVVHLVSPEGRYDIKYLRNYAVLQVRDVLARIKGVGQVRLFGSGDYAIRVWLDPQKVASYNLTASDVVRAIRDQNLQVAAGVIGGQPMTPGVEYQLSINAQGRLVTEQEFGDIILKTGADGTVTRLREVGRIELGVAEYSMRSQLSNKQAVALPITQTPGSNAIETSDNVRATMAELSKVFPEGVEYKIVYDPTVFVRDSIKAVVITLLEAIALVVLVVVLFLQTWRASIIPLVAVPVSVVGTFAVLLALGFSINALSLFGLVLAIGIVVDDAIVVVENVERNIANGLSPKEATYKAMREVSGPIIAIALVLTAVFVPIAFVSGLTGQFYRQFAVTIAISTIISAFNSLTLSPALAAALLKPHGAPKDALTRGIDRLFGWVFRPFNRVFGRASDGYGRRVGRIIGRTPAALGVYAVLAVFAGFLFWHVPKGFVPAQDKGYLIGIVQLPDAASLDRTDKVVQRAAELALQQPGVTDIVQFPGLNVVSFSNAPNVGAFFIGLDDFSRRTTPDKYGLAIAAGIQQKVNSIEEAYVAIFPPPPVQGIGSLGGFKMQLEDRANLGLDEMNAAAQAVLAQMYKTPQFSSAFTGYQINVPQLFADVDREKAKRQGIALADVFETMQIYLGSLYVNDFNRFGRTYQVMVQADASFRSQAEDIGELKTRNAAGEMIPLASVVNVKQSYGPDRVQHYNGYLSADLNGQAKPGVSSGESIALMQKIAADVLPNGIKYSWTELTYQEIIAGSASMLVFPLCVLLVFLVLAAQYESWSLPFTVILIVPMGLLSAITGVWLTGGDNNIFTQIALVVLVGLACKNAILIVEFAQVLEHEGRDPVQAALEACRLRLRPILMTSAAFIMGVVPLVTASGAGAEMRHAMGVAVFAGMLGVTLFGLFLTPVFYVVIRKFARRGKEPSHA